MFAAIKKLLGINSQPVDYKQMLSEGGIIVDVRTKGEFSSGHIKGSINIPLDTLSKNLSKFKSKDQSIITCCASGMRSASAKSILKANGYSNVYNGGGWASLKNKI